MSFRISVERPGDWSVYSLHDDAVGSSASVLPAYGFNLFDLRLPVAGEVRPVVVASPTFAEAPRGSGGNGVPILFPFPNRIRRGAFTFQGKSFALPANHGPDAIHGFVLDRAWEVVEHRATADEAFLIGRFQLSVQAPEVRDLWPTDAVLQVRYALSGRRLTMTTTVANPTAVDLPYGFGIHPYFRLPFPPGGRLDRTKIVIPASKTWTLKDSLPTGEVVAVEPRVDFREGRPIEGLKLDDVLTDLAYDGAEGFCRLIDLDKGGEFRLGFDRSFRELVVYNPPAKPDVISIEPYTQTTDAINLQARGVSAGLRVLGHGQSDVLSLTMQTQG